MLYDKRWDKPEVKADPFSLDSLIAWLEKQPSEGAYDFQNCGGQCLVGQYMTAMGITWDYMVYLDFRDAFAESHSDFPKGVFRIAAFFPHTFGAALGRAHRAAANRSPQENASE